MIVGGAEHVRTLAIVLPGASRCAALALGPLPEERGVVVLEVSAARFRLGLGPTRWRLVKIIFGFIVSTIVSFVVVVASCLDVTAALVVACPVPVEAGVAEARKTTRGALR